MPVKKKTISYNEYTEGILEEARVLWPSLDFSARIARILEDWHNGRTDPNGGRRAMLAEIAASQREILEILREGEGKKRDV